MTRPRLKRPHLPLAVLAHPFELAFGALFALVGAGLILHGHEIKVSAVQNLPIPLVVAWEVFLLSGGPMVALGLLWNGSERTARALERTGLYLGASAWGTYALAVVWYAYAVGARTWVVPVGQAVTIALACLGRAAALRKVQVAIDKVVPDGQ